MDKISWQIFHGIDLHFQITIETNLLGKRTARILRLSPEDAKKLNVHRINDIGFTVFRYGQPKTPKHIVPYVDKNTLLVARLYWTPETFKDRRTVDRVSYHIHAYLKNKIDTAESWQNYIKTHFQGDDWVFQDYISQD